MRRWLSLLICGPCFVHWRPSRAPRQARGAEGKSFNKQKFLQRPEFDLLSLQDFRREALIQYSNTNQSEPLRILIFFLLTISGAASPGFFPSNAPLWFFPAALLFTVACGLLFARERGKRTAQLLRLEREYAIGDLQVELVDVAAAKTMELQALRAQKRVVALYGNFQQVKESLQSALPFRRRFEQSGVLILPVCSSLEGADEVAFASWGEKALRLNRPWLAKPLSPRRWRSYFQALLKDRDTPLDSSLWVGLNFRGRVMGSDFGTPIWDELLAAMPPTSPCNSTEPSSALADATALAAQRDFYEALAQGDGQRLQKIFEPLDDAELSEALRVEDMATNLSQWDVVLAPENRPQLVVASCDAVVTGQTATTSCVEFPVLGPTLLATQRWVREEGGPWRLLSHRSIPYATQVEARVALRCDHRGCIAFGKALDAMR